MATYTINFYNNSGTPGSICVFQQKPDSPTPNVFSLAWLVKFAEPGTILSISWNTDYSFVWAKTGQLVPGATFETAEVLPTNPHEGNSVTLIKDDGRYKFVDQKSDFRKGTFIIDTDGSIAHNQASAGIGMSGAGMYAVQSMPRYMSFFSPIPNYWVAFGYYQQGLVLDTNAIANKAQVEFPHGIFSMNVTLNVDNTWAITQGQD